MKKILKKIFIIILVIVSLVAIALIFVSGVTSISKRFQDKNVDLLANYQKNIDFESVFSKEGEIQQVATKYSILYKNNNKRKMYVFSMPIRKYIDNNYIYVKPGIDKVNEYQYITNNIDYSILYEDDYLRISDEKNWFKLSFDEIYAWNFIELSNNSMSLKGDSIQYINENGNEIFVSPSYSGMVVNYKIDESVNQLVFPIEFSELKVNNQDAGYVVLSEKNLGNISISDNITNSVFVISRPIVSDMNGRKSLGGAIELIKKNKKYQLVCSVPEGTVNLSFTVNYYYENMFFDCTAYQREANVNHVFGDYVVYDSETRMNLSNNYIKFDIRSFTPKKSQALDRITLSVYVLDCKKDTEFEVYAVPNDWCAWELTWNKQPNYQEKIGYFKLDGSGWYTLDLTEYIKSLIDENYYNLINNSIMIKLKDGSTGYAIMASADNSIYPPYFEVDYTLSNQ